MASIMVRICPSRRRKGSGSGRFGIGAVSRRRCARFSSVRARAGEAAGDRNEPFPDWFIRITRPGVDLDPAIDENRTPQEGVEL
jgi:hypothetical protein